MMTISPSSTQRRSVKQFMDATRPHPPPSPFHLAAVAWGLGVLLRYCVLFPLRLLALVLGLLLVMLLFPAVKLLGKVINVSRWEIL
jgi:hypothetical protein